MYEYIRLGIQFIGYQRIAYLPIALFIWYRHMGRKSCYGVAVIEYSRIKWLKGRNLFNISRSKLTRTTNTS